MSSPWASPVALGSARTRLASEALKPSRVPDSKPKYRQRTSGEEVAEGLPAGVLVVLLLGVPVSEDVGDAHTGRAAHAAEPQPPTMYAREGKPVW